MKYKVLKSAAHNFAHSFTSSLHWAADDYALSHLARVEPVRVPDAPAASSRRQQAVCSAPRA